MLSGRSSKNAVSIRSERSGSPKAVRAGWLASGLGRRQQGRLSALGNRTARRGSQRRVDRTEPEASVLEFDCLWTVQEARL